MVKFILKHDQGDVFRFASLQSPLAQAILSRHHADIGTLVTFYVVLDDTLGPNSSNTVHSAGSLLSRSDAVLFVLEQLEGAYKLLARSMQLLPRPARDWAYCLVARHRYRLFGRYDACPLPSKATRDRFLDL